jgi:hypothetical protein
VPLKAWTSFVNDLSKHEELKDHMAIGVAGCYINVNQTTDFKDLLDDEDATIEELTNVARVPRYDVIIARDFILGFN